MPDGQTYDPPPAGPAWTVTRQVPTTKIGSDNKPIWGVDVTFQLADGTSDTVFVPNDQYSVSTVQSLVAARAGMLHAVSQLTSETPAGS